MRLFHCPVVPNSLTHRTIEVTVTATIEGLEISKIITVEVNPTVYTVDADVKFSAETKYFDYEAINSATNTELEFEDIVYYLVNQDSEKLNAEFDFAVEFENGNIISKKLTIVTKKFNDFLLFNYFKTCFSGGERRFASAAGEHFNEVFNIIFDLFAA